MWVPLWVVKWRSLIKTPFFVIESDLCLVIVGRGSPGKVGVSWLIVLVMSIIFISFSYFVQMYVGNIIGI